MTSADRILILSSPKVATTAWFEAIKRAAPTTAYVHQNHYINARAVKLLSEISSRSDGSQNIVNTRLLREYVLKIAPGITNSLIDGRWSGRPLKILSGVRDPVDRGVSMLFYLADFYGHKKLPLAYRDGAHFEQLASFFVENSRLAMAGNRQNGTFELLFRRSLIHFFDWFNEEIEEIFGISVFNTPFDYDNRCLVARNGNVKLFCYRYEDLRPEYWPRVSRAVSDFLGISVRKLPRRNAAAGRRSRELYENFRERLVLPVDLIDQFYVDPILHHFYLERELKAFKSRWGTRAHAA